MKSLAGIVVVALLLVSGTSCSKPAPPPPSKPPTEKSSLEPILGAIDLPARAATLKSGTVPAGGWAVAESGVQRVVLYIDKQFVGYATFGGARPDIAKAFPSFPNAATSGWNAAIDISPFPAGQHQLILQVETKAGNVHDFPAVPFEIR